MQRRKTEKERIFSPDIQVLMTVSDNQLWLLSSLSLATLYQDTYIHPSSSFTNWAIMISSSSPNFASKNFHFLLVFHIGMQHKVNMDLSQ
jgi:hypothetical protein